MSSLSLAVLISCASNWDYTDADEDGFSVAYGDCWDNPVGPEGSDLTGADIYPDAAESCDGYDNNCDGIIDDGCDETFPEETVPDEEVIDGDGDGYSIDDGDCDDTDDTVYPGAIDSFFDGVAADCDDGFEQLRGDLSSIQYSADANDYLGYGTDSLVNLGDVNDDGYDDLGMGVFYSDEGASDGGAVAILYGGQAYSASTSIYESDVLWSRSEANAKAGHPLAGAGDVNGDGLSDFTVAARGEDAVYLIHGNSSLDDDDFSNGAASVSDLNIESLSYGDHNADGYSDIVMADKTDSSIYVFQGPVTGSLSPSDGDVSLSAGSSDAAGSALAFHQDIDGDGYDDLVVAAEEYDGSTATDAGSVCVELGPVTSSTMCSSSHYVIQGDSASDYIGQMVKIVPDRDGDGQDELLVGAAYATHSSYTGAVYVFDGGDVSSGGTATASDATVIFVGDDDGVGYAATTGDLTGDGSGDICLGAYKHTKGTSSHIGRVDCFDGNSLVAGTYYLASDKVSSRLVGWENDQWFGYSVVLMDLDGDGSMDLFSGSPNANYYSGSIDVVENNF